MTRVLLKEVPEYDGGRDPRATTSEQYIRVKNHQNDQDGKRHHLMTPLVLVIVQIETTLEKKIIVEIRAMGSCRIRVEAQR